MRTSEHIQKRRRGVGARIELLGTIGLALGLLAVAAAVVIAEMGRPGGSATAARSPGTDPTGDAVASRAPLCKPISRYRVEQLNVATSPCELYFYADRSSYGVGESRFRVVIRRGAPVEIVDGEPRFTLDEPRPYWYRWVILDDDGNVARAWLAEFMQNRDGLHHTIVSLPEEDWQRSRLEIYFKDVDGDGISEDVTFELNIAAIVADEQAPEDHE